MDTGISDFRIKTYVLGMVSTNCYVVYNDKTRDAVIIDPADDGRCIIDKCRELKVTPVAMLITHGHFDHILAATDVIKELKIPVYAGKSEYGMLSDSNINMTADYCTQGVEIQPDFLLLDGQEFELAGFEWKTIFSPGHTKGSVCYYIADEDVLISGDTLFLESFGRTDFPGGSSSAIADSIVNKLFKLPEDTIVYPGHGDPTTIGHEKKYNPISYYLK